MSRILLSAALIVKNEANFLPACLASLQGIVDEVVVVDTGSTDRTREIAESGGARVFDFPWTGDFSAARNHGLEHCTSEWILYIDADERIRPGSVTNLGAELASNSHVAYQVLLHPLQGFTSFWILRLFRNEPAIRFRGVIHENLWPAVQEYRAANGGEVGNSGLILDHDGYEGNQERKNQRNLPLLLKNIEQDPNRVYSWCHLANIYTELQKFDLAEQAWTNALQVVRKKRRLLPEDVLPYTGLIQRGNEVGRDVSALLDEARDRFPSNLNLEWQRGRAFMREGKFETAIDVFKGLVAVGSAGEYDHSVAYDLRLFHVFSYDSLAVCYFRLARYSESRHYYELASQHDPQNLEYRVKQSLCTRLAREAADAVKVL
jgi:glycosyltransferase involved in cell wall biosynthesis